MPTGPRISGTASHEIFGPCPDAAVKKVLHASSWRRDGQILPQITSNANPYSRPSSSQNSNLRCEYKSNFTHNSCLTQQFLIQPIFNYFVKKKDYLNQFIWFTVIFFSDKFSPPKVFSTSRYFKGQQLFLFLYIFPWPKGRVSFF